MSAPADSAPTLSSAAFRASAAIPQFELGGAPGDELESPTQHPRDLAFDNGVSYDKPAYATLRGARIKITSVAYEHVE